MKTSAPSDRHTNPTTYSLAGSILFFVVTLTLARTAPADTIVWTEDFSSGVGKLDQILGSGTTLFTHNASAGGFIEGSFPRGAVDRRSSDDIANHSEAMRFGLRAVAEPVGTSNFSLGYIGFFGSATANFEDMLSVAFWRQGTTASDDIFTVRVVESDGTFHDGNAISAPINTRYYVRANWLPSVGVNGTFEAVLATGNYDDLGGTTLGVSSISPATPVTFAVNELGLATHEFGAAGTLEEINVYELAYVVPEPSHATMLLSIAAFCAFFITRLSRRVRSTTPAI